jgi:hypothetical protein
MERVLAAIRDPDGFAVACDDPDIPLMAQLATAATLGIATYGGIAHAAEGVTAIGFGAARAVLVAGGAWALAIPALVVLGALSGSPVSWRRALLGSLVTVAFGGGSFLASVPVVSLLEVVTEGWFARHAIHLLVVFGVGGCSSLIFVRTMAALEGSRRVLHHVWIGLFGLLFLELAWLADLFRFAV